jgi:hypothetical protein
LVFSRCRAVLATITAAAILAACGSASASPTATPTPEPTATPAASESLPLPSLPSSAKDLEELLPDEIGGMELQKFSMQGSEFLAGGGGSDEDTQQFLEDLGVSPEDVAVALAFSMGGEADAPAAFAFRARGASSQQLIDTFKASQATGASAEPLEWRSATVGGKPVEMATDPSVDQTIYLYAVGDVLFLISASDEADAAEALAGLP